MARMAMARALISFPVAIPYNNIDLRRMDKYFMRRVSLILADGDLPIGSLDLAGESGHVTIDEG
jgi:hypothetical protein